MITPSRHRAIFPCEVDHMSHEAIFQTMRDLASEKVGMETDEEKPVPCL